MYRRGSSVVCRCGNDRRTVFQAFPPRNGVSLEDVQDLLDATTNIPDHVKKELFFANGETATS